MIRKIIIQSKKEGGKKLGKDKDAMGRKGGGENRGRRRKREKEEKERNREGEIERETEKENHPKT